MLSDLLPSLRYVRANLIAGLLWIVAIDVMAQPGFTRHRYPGANRVWDALSDIASVAAPASTVVALLFAAYILGVTSEACFGALVRLITKWTVRAHRLIAAWLVAGRETKDLPPQSLVATTTLDDFLSSASGRQWRWFAAQSPSNEATGSTRATFVAALKTSATVVIEVDRLRGEAEFRLQMLPPIVGLSVAAGYQISWWSVLIGAVCFLLFAASANHCAELANDVLADWASNP